MADGQIAAAEIEEYRAYVGRSMSVNRHGVGAQVAAIMPA